MTKFQVIYQARAPVFDHDTKTSESDERRGEAKTFITFESFLGMIKHMEQVFDVTSSKTGMFTQRVRVDQVVGLYYRKET